MFCSQCRHRLADEDAFCTQCGMKRSSETASRSPDDVSRADRGSMLPSNVDSFAVAQATAQGFSNYQPVWHFILLSIAIFPIYVIYWFYRNWKHLKIHKNLDIGPGWKTVSLLIPVWGFMPFYGQLRYIRYLAEELHIEEKFSPWWIAFIYISVNLIYFLNVLWRFIPELYLLPSLPILIIPLSFVQRTLNIYWAREQEGLPRRESFTVEQTVVLVIGGILWLLYLIGMFFLAA